VVDVGLAGVARSGKDSVGAVLVGEGFVKRSFAAPMRQALAIMNGQVETVDGFMPLMDALYRFGGWEGLKEHAPSVRVLLQRLGTGVGRELWGEDFWVDLAFRDLKFSEDYVFTDVRFPNEVEAIRGRGGVVWNVVRPGVGVANGHVSESALAGFVFDETIVNDGSLEDLEGKVLSCLKKL
jgi:hypothetical protein